MTQTHEPITGVWVRGSIFTSPGRFTTWGLPERSSQTVVLDVPRSMPQWTPPFRATLRISGMYGRPAGASGDARRPKQVGPESYERRRIG